VAAGQSGFPVAARQGNRSSQLRATYVGGCSVFWLKISKIEWRCDGVEGIGVDLRWRDRKSARGRHAASSNNINGNAVIVVCHKSRLDDGAVVLSGYRLRAASHPQRCANRPAAVWTSSCTLIDATCRSGWPIGHRVYVWSRVYERLCSGNALGSSPSPSEGLRPRSRQSRWMHAQKCEPWNDSILFCVAELHSRLQHVVEVHQLSTSLHLAGDTADCRAATEMMEWSPFVL